MKGKFFNRHSLECGIVNIRDNPMNEMFPRWSLDDLYNALNDEAMNKDMAFAAQTADNLAAKFEGKIATSTGA